MDGSDLTGVTGLTADPGLRGRISAGDDGVRGRIIDAGHRFARASSPVVASVSRFTDGGEIHRVGTSGSGLSPIETAKRMVSRIATDARDCLATGARKSGYPGETAIQFVRDVAERMGIAAVQMKDRVLYLAAVTTARAGGSFRTLRRDIAFDFRRIVQTLCHDVPNAVRDKMRALKRFRKDADVHPVGVPDRSRISPWLAAFVIGGVMLGAGRFTYNTMSITHPDTMGLEIPVELKTAWKGNEPYITVLDVVSFHADRIVKSLDLDNNLVTPVVDAASQVANTATDLYGKGQKLFEPDSALSNEDFAARIHAAVQANLSPEMKRMALEFIGGERVQVAEVAPVSDAVGDATRRVLETSARITAEREGTRPMVATPVPVRARQAREALQIDAAKRSQIEARSRISADFERQAVHVMSLVQGWDQETTKGYLDIRMKNYVDCMIRSNECTTDDAITGLTIRSGKSGGVEAFLWDRQTGRLLVSQVGNTVQKYNDPQPRHVPAATDPVPPSSPSPSQGLFLR